MRIAIIGSRHLLSGYSGIESGLVQFLPLLVQRGHEVTVFAGGLREDDKQAGMTRYHGVEIVEVPALRGKHTETLSRSAMAVTRAIRERYDVLHFQHQGPGIFSLITRPLRTPSVVTMCGLDWQRAKWNPAAKAAIRGAERAAVYCASSIAVLSQRIQHYFAETYGRDTTYIPNGLPDRRRPTSTDALAQYGLMPDGYVVFAARLVPEKGCHDLISAWNGISTHRKLVIAGAGRYDEAYVVRLRAIADPDRVIFTGHLERDVMDQLTAHAYLFVLPSYLEGMSNALLEAIAFGRACLVSDIAENLEAIDGDGFTFRCGDAADLGGTLARLMADEEGVRAMRLRVAASASRRCTWEQVAARYETLYLSAIGQQKMRPAAS